MVINYRIPDLHYVDKELLYEKKGLIHKYISSD